MVGFLIMREERAAPAVVFDSDAALSWSEIYGPCEVKRFCEDFPCEHGGSCFSAGDCMLPWRS